MIIFIIILWHLIFFWVVVRLYHKSTNEIVKSKRRLDGKTIIVTGGTSGIGLEVAMDFAERGAKVIIAGPFEEEGKNVRKNIVDQTGNENVFFKLLDLASLESVREFADSIKRTEDRLDILVNNAGVSGIFSGSVTNDGMNYVMQVNYFGHFLLTLLLISLLKETGTSTDAARVINISSALHKFAKLNFDNLNAIGIWRHQRIQTYSNSKLCLILFSRELARKLTKSNVVINAVDPGAVGTRILEGGTSVLDELWRLLIKYTFKNAWEGAQTTIHVAVDKKAGEVSGQFFKNCHLSQPSTTATDSELAKKLWDESVKLVKLTEKELAECLA